MTLPLLLSVYSILFGLIVGSFLNVCILRIPEGMTLGGRSQCPQCHTTIAWYHNIPVISFLILKGKCANCTKRISWQYPLVEALTGLLSLATFLRVGGELTPYFLWFSLFVCPLIVLSFIDMRHQILPDVITLPAIPAGLITLLILNWPDWQNAGLTSVYGILAGGGTLYLLATLYSWIRKREGMGGGDIKLSAALGAFLGIRGIVFTFFISSVLALLFGIVSTITNRKQEEPIIIPYGPFLATAALIYFFRGPEILTFYLSLVHPF